MLVLLALSLGLSGCCDHALPALPDPAQLGLPTLSIGEPLGDPIEEMIRRSSDHGWVEVHYADEPAVTTLPTADLQWIAVELEAWRVYALALKAAGRWLE